MTTDCLGLLDAVMYLLLCQVLSVRVSKAAAPSSGYIFQNTYTPTYDYILHALSAHVGYRDHLLT
jgi:hypothetical protein